ncbi:hypothetical protein BDB00DRAFT_790484 [Zychaea mexicana]|uniref:uncharacterized protein n=1 Tax=Zychaea mexicana TaxID=64656 RepID=UPI0022FF4510|nr:uncharacterized protein BDB00DRAFT_790484 [Zychaea mexicana]KAI9490218.1 hypothetical protein BDB00DRAFT_790484 [Zychaea mexicana]
MEFSLAVLDDNLSESLCSSTSPAEKVNNAHSNPKLPDNTYSSQGNHYLTTMSPMEAISSSEEQPTFGDRVLEQLPPSLHLQQVAHEEIPQYTASTLNRYKQDDGDPASIPDLALVSNGSNGMRHVDILDLQKIGSSSSDGEGESVDLQAVMARHEIHAADNEEITTTSAALIEERDPSVQCREWVSTSNQGLPLPPPKKYPTDSAIDSSSSYFSLLAGASDNSSTADNTTAAVHQRSGYCFLCQKQYGRHRDFLRHQLAKHSGKKLICKFCHKEMAYRKDSLKRHLEKACKGDPLP